MHNSSRKRWPAAALLRALLAIVLIMLPVGKAMAFFDSMKVNLFSEMKGVVTLNGEPVAGAVVKRLAVPGSGKEYRDQSVTDSQGQFQFVRIETSSMMKLLPGNSSVYQEVIIEHEGKEYLAWKIGAASDRYNGELNDDDILGTDKEIDINLVCELTAEESMKSAAGLTVVSGICSWTDAVIIK